MEFIRPPTDNLYKFIAISGLAILLASTIIPFLRLWQLELRRARIGARINHSMLILSRRAPGIDEALKLTKQIQSAGDTVDEETRELWIRQYDSITQYWTDAEAEQIRQIEQEEKETAIALAESEALAGQVKDIWSLALSGLGVGLGLTGLGFWLWWARVQKFEDKILRHRAETESEED